MRLDLFGSIVIEMFSLRVNTKQIRRFSIPSRLCYEFVSLYFIFHSISYRYLMNVSL
jgi:hypothetical protein